MMSIASRKSYVPDSIRDDTCRQIQLLGEVFDPRLPGAVRAAAAPGLRDDGDERSYSKASCVHPGVRR